jgi:protein SCO1
MRPVHAVRSFITSLSTIGVSAIDVFAIDMFVAGVFAMGIATPLHSNDRIDATGSAATDSPAAARADDTFRPAIPDVAVLDQHNRALRFHSDLIKTRTVAINFIFTSCTTTCPLLTTAMRAIQKELAGRVGHDVWLISVSVDPAVDRPERLRALAEQYRAGDGWTFVTGASAEINRLLKALGSYGGDVTAHTTTMMIGNERTGRWIRTSALAPTSTNVKLILDAARGSAGDSASRE